MHKKHNRKIWICLGPLPGFASKIMHTEKYIATNIRPVFKDIPCALEIKKHDFALFFSHDEVFLVAMWHFSCYISCQFCAWFVIPHVLYFLKLIVVLFIMAKKILLWFLQQQPKKSPLHVCSNLGLFFGPVTFSYIA